MTQPQKHMKLMKPAELIADAALKTILTFGLIILTLGMAKHAVECGDWIALRLAGTAPVGVVALLVGSAASRALLEVILYPWCRKR